MAAPKIILELIERFERNLEAYKSGSYNETQVRREFIDPFFEALGWDVNNKEGNAEAYKDVIHEDAVKVGGITKAPDYSFRIGGQRKFFVEAKKPSVNIKDAPAAAFQVRRYAWSAKLPLSIVTDFDELVVYDCRIKPDQKDQADKARVKYYTYRQYAEKWDEIAAIFSKDAILKGSFDKYAESNRTKRGTAEVDSAFLAEIESWREMLARNIALRNTLTVRELNDSVQRIIDRIIFLRIAEDRGIEDYGSLRSIGNGNDTYGRLQELFYKADDRYNSGLFHFRHEKDEVEPPDKLTPDLQIDDKPLKDILKTLYYPDSPYEFAVLPADILGQVYEQFLGKVIRLTSDHRAVVEDKPEVKKAGGVFYTPTYIVEYIVKNTVGKLLDGKTSKKAESLRILDPACGSGSFLLGAYQYLLDWHLKWYMENDPEKHAKTKKPALYSGQGGAWGLTTAERKRILLNNIYGVDVDSQAVEVTKLSLLLKVLEGETGETLNQQRRLFHERALPNLGGNIKYGNSLIGPDFYVGKQMNLMDDEETHRVNVFDWQAEFPEIFKAGGFDAVIGNPPYIFTREQLSEEERQYFATKYQLSWEKHNTFMLFMEQLLRLIEKNGKGGFIVPNSWLTIESAKLLREAYVPRLELIADLSYLVFRRVSMEPCIFTVTGHDLQNSVLTLRINSEERLVETKPASYDRRKWNKPNYRIVFSDNSEVATIIDKILQNSIALGDVFDVRTGLQAYEEGRGTPPQSADDVKNHVFDREKRVDGNSIKYLQGRDVGRYELNWSSMWMQYGPWLSQPREIDIFKRPRVLLREITSDYPYCLNAMLVQGDYLNNKSILSILHNDDDVVELKKLLGILNSLLMSIFYKQKAVKSVRKVFPKVVVKNLREFPYPRAIGKSESKLVVQLADQHIDLQKRIASVKTNHERTTLQRQIDATDKQIDKLVYELYELTDEEIAIVEGK